jgi:glycosyltransferase involved in cell wall biosynthesis
MKKTIVHIIYDLGRGGAETMLVTVVKHLPEYNNIIVTVRPQNHFKNELQCDKYYTLNLKSLLQLPVAAMHLKKIIENEKADIVHSHLYWPTVLARIATPKNIPVITTIHTSVARADDYKRRYIRIIDRITYRLRKNIIIAVSQTALNDYFTFLKLQPFKFYLLHTFVDIKIFNNNTIIDKDPDRKPFRMITVGALRKSKNYHYLVRAFKKLKKDQFQLDIYGEGPLRNELEREINKDQLKINLKGEIKNIETIMPQYDLYVMSSAYEGFSLSVLEAMATKMPLLLSDIRSFREQGDSTAVYFDLNNVDDFIDKLKMLSADEQQLHSMGVAAYERVKNNFTLEQHMEGLKKIYRETLNGK